MTTTAVDQAGGRAVHVLRSEDELARVEPEWRRLAEERGNAFVTPEWFRCWLAHYGEGCSPHVAAATGSDGNVSALLPLVETRGRFGPMLRFGGYNLGDFFEPLGTVAVGADAIDMLADAVTSSGTVLVLDNLDRTSSLVSRAEATAADVLLPAIRLGGTSGEDYLRGLSGNLRSQLSRKGRALERDHQVRFRCSGPERLDADMAHLFRLHDARWQGRGGSSLNSPRARDMLADFAAAALARGWLRLWLLEADGQPIAAWYGWRLGRRYAYYTSGFDPAFAGYSPGLQLLVHSIKSAADEGADVYDLLLGDETYKARFATEVRSARTIVVAPRLHPVYLATLAGRRARSIADRLPQPVRDSVRPIARLLPTARER